MSDLLDILESINADHNGRIWVICKPITESAPRDLPEIKKLADEYWTAKIVVRNGDTYNNITEWFSVPYDNIRKSLKNHINGPCIINYENMDNNTKKELLEDSKPVFSLETDSNSKVFRWMDER